MTTAVTEDSILIAAGSVEIEAAAAPAIPRVSIVAYTGGLMTVPGWGPVAIDLAGIDATAEQIGILADHDSTLSGIVGHGQARVEGDKLVVAGAIAPTTDAARQIIELARAGFRFQASVGVAPTDYERIRPGDTVVANGRTITSPRGGMTLVRSSVLREVSIVAIGADRKTSVAIAASMRRNLNMNTETLEPTAEQIREAALAETKRVNGIRAACGGRFGDIEAKAIEEEWDVDQTKLAVLRASRPTTSVIHGVDYVPDRTVLEAAILGHMNCEGLAEKTLGPNAAQRARDMRVTSLMDICRASLRMEGIEPPQGRDALIRASLSTMSMPTALGDAANKVLMEAYNESPATWQSFAAVKSANDFKKHTGIRTTQTGELEQVAPGGELKFGSIKEATYQYQVDTFGKIIGIDRRDIINDDLGVFDDTARSLGRSAMRAVSDLVFRVILANGGDFFSADNGNYAVGVDTILGILALDAGITKMMSQRDDEGRDLDIRPKVLLVPPELTQTGKELLQSDYIQRVNDKEPTGNALKNAVSLEVEPRLSNSGRFTGSSSKAWYLFAGPQDAAVIVAFLQGNQTPTVEFFGFDSDPNVLAAKWRVYFDFGCALADARAAYKAKGEA